MIRIWKITLLIVSVCLVFSNKSFGQNIEDKIWNQSFIFTNKPTEFNSGWINQQWGKGTSALINGWLKIYTPFSVHNQAAGSIYKIASSSKIWDGSVASSVEFRVSVSTPGRFVYGAAVVLADGKKMYQLRLKSCGMTTYRIDLKEGKAMVYCEDGKVPFSVIEGENLDEAIADKNFLYFGDSGQGIEGTSTWEFLRWTNGKLLKRDNLRTISYGFLRKLNHSWFSDDARQWENHDKAIIISDMGTTLPNENLAFEARQKGKWRVFSYQTENITGRLLTTLEKTNAKTITLPLNVSGQYAVYLGLPTAQGFHNVERSGIRAKLSGQSVYKNLFNDIAWFDYRRDAIKEVLLTVSDIKKGDYLEFNQIPFLPGTLAYIKLVPVTKAEKELFNKENNISEYKNNIATIDGHAIFLYNKARTAEDLEAHLRQLESGDYGKWWYQILGSDLVNYPSKIGTVPGDGSLEQPRWYDEEFVAAVNGVMDNKINSLQTVRNFAKKQNAEFSVMFRAQGWYAALPFEETFNSKFYKEHPEWRCKDEYGTPVLYMSFAIPQVRQHLLAMMKESIDMCDPDGIGILFNRGDPFMLWEDAFADQFKLKYGLNLKDVDTNDSRIFELRAQIMTGFIKEMNQMLCDLAAKNNKKTYKFSMAVLGHTQNDELGLDVDNWIKQGLVDDVTVQPGDVAYYCQVAKNTKSSVYPIITTWDNISRPRDFCEKIMSYYNNGAKGITIWDGDIASFNKGVEPHMINVINYLGHKDLIDYWSRTFSPRPNIIPIVKLHDLEYSGWLPNHGF